MSGFDLEECIEEFNEMPKHRREKGVQSRHVEKVREAILHAFDESDFMRGGLEDVENEELEDLEDELREAAEILERWAEGLKKEKHYRQNDGKRD